MARNRTFSAPRTSGPSIPADIKRFIPTGGGNFGYLVIGASNSHGTPDQLAAACDAWLEKAGSDNERGILIAQAATLAERWPEGGWDRLVAHLEAGAAAVDEAAAA